MTVMSALTRLSPASTTRRYARLSRSRESASRQRGSVGGNICPMSPRPGDHHPEALFSRRFDQVPRLLRLPMGGGDVELVRNARLAQDLEGGLDTRLVAFGADDDQHIGHAQAASSITV